MFIRTLCMIANLFTIVVILSNFSDLNASFLPDESNLNLNPVSHVSHTTIFVQGLIDKGPAGSDIIDISQFQYNQELRKNKLNYALTELEKFKGIDFTYHQKFVTIAQSNFELGESLGSVLGQVIKLPFLNSITFLQTSFGNKGTDTVISQLSNFKGTIVFTKCFASPDNEVKIRKALPIAVIQ